jgi:hypothetical protein
MRVVCLGDDVQQDMAITLHSPESDHGNLSAKANFEGPVYKR